MTLTGIKKYDELPDTLTWTENIDELRQKLNNAIQEANTYIAWLDELIKHTPQQPPTQIENKIENKTEPKITIENIERESTENLRRIHTIEEINPETIIENTDGLMRLSKPLYLKHSSLKDTKNILQKIKDLAQ